MGPGTTYLIHVADGAGTQRAVDVTDTAEYGVYQVRSTHPKPNQPIQTYIFDVYRNRCTCHAGKFDFAGCKMGVCIHGLAARRRHVLRLYPGAAGDDLLFARVLDDMFGGRLRLPAPRAS